MSQEAEVHNYVGCRQDVIAEAFGKAVTTYDKTRRVSARCRPLFTTDKPSTDLSGL